MKTMNWLLGLLAVSLLCFTSCSKSGPPEQGEATEISGVKVDLAKLDTAFADAPDALRTSLGKFRMNIRYGQHVEALAELDKMVNDPGVTEPQKQILTTVIEQMKQVIGKAAPPAAQ